MGGVVLKEQADSSVHRELVHLRAPIVGEEPQRAAKHGRVALQLERTRMQFLAAMYARHEDGGVKARQQLADFCDRLIAGQMLILFYALMVSDMRHLNPTVNLQACPGFVIGLS